MLQVPVGTYYIHQSSLRRERGILLAFDFYKRTELALGGLTILAATVDVMQDNRPSSDLSVTGIVVDPTGKKVQFRLTDVSSVADTEYRLVCQPALSDGSFPSVESAAIFPVQV